MGMSRCLIARCCGFRLLMSGRRNHRCFSNNAPEKEPTTKQQIGKWLVGGGGLLAIVTFGWDMWRHRQEQEPRRQEQERVKNIIVNASFKAREPRVKIERKIIKDEMHQLLDLDDPRPILIWGNHEVGKSTILWEVLQEKQWNNGVLHIKLTQNNHLATEKVMSALAVLHEEEVVRGLRGAKTRMGRKPIIILEVPRGVFEPSVMSSVSAFAKSWGFDDEVAKVLVMVSSAVSATAFDADGRERRFFVPPLTSEELSQKEVEEFLRHHGGEEASTHKSDMIQLTGGNIGVMEDVAQNAKETSWEEAKSKRLAVQRSQVQNFLGIDNQGGFGPEKVRMARTLAKAVAHSSFEQCVDAERFREHFTPAHMAAAVRRQGAHCIYVDARAEERRYCAVSRTVHDLLKKV